MSLPISLQLYSLRDDAPKDFIGLIRQVAGIGYDAVEFAGYHGHSAAELRAALEDNGLRCSGTHTAIDLLNDDQYDSTLRAHETLGTKNIIIPWLPLELHSTAEATLATAQRLTKLTQKVEKDGFFLGFHAHDADMKPLDDGRSTWYILGENTPDSFLLQFDTANAMHGGSDPVQPLLDFPGRGKTVHFKEYPFDGSSIGEGKIPFAEVIKALPTAGAEWIVVEQEQYGGRTPIESCRVSFENLKAML
ncbi:MAG: sugar phosphate isomerase/epimerase [Armatimonadetes bacterium]|nr:sugar phosphate isomerase/epimerase [Armatimonadota bacterium]